MKNRHQLSAEFEAKSRELIAAKSAHTSARRAWHAAMKKTTGGEWAAVIKSITDIDTRLQVASILWWDWKGSRRALGSYREAYCDLVRPKYKLVQAALETACGYPHHLAKRRVAALRYSTTTAQ